MIKAVFTKKLLLAYFFLLLFFGSSLSYHFGFNYEAGQGQAPPSEIKKIYRAKPGLAIFIGVIPPEKEGEKPLPELDIFQEREPEQPLKPEEIARLEKRLSELEREKDILSGDFYGINQYGYRYAMVFDRLGYIRFRLHQVDTEMAKIRQKLCFKMLN